MNRWLTLTLYAPLQVVQTTNYIRYGPHGVRRFHPGADAMLKPHPYSVMLGLLLKKATDKVLYEYPNLTLYHKENFDLNGVNVWYSELSAEHLQVTWVWDFFRLYSGVKIRVQKPDPTDKEHFTEWQQTYDGLYNVQAGDKAILTAGDILQIYPIDPDSIQFEDDDQNLI